MGPRNPRSTVLTPVEEAMIVEFRRRTLLPLDDVLGCLRESIPKLTRSSLHRCLERHGISRLPESKEKASKHGRFANTPGQRQLSPARPPRLIQIDAPFSSRLSRYNLASITSPTQSGGCRPRPDLNRGYE
jgi:hypothetical protein